MAETVKQDGSAGAWAKIEEEKRRDKFIRRVAYTAWTVTFALAAIFTVTTGMSVAQFAKAAYTQQLPWMTVLSAAIPLLVTLGFVSVLVATLSTVGIFLRLRTASLSEIQLRLAALEEMLAEKAKA